MPTKFEKDILNRPNTYVWSAIQADDAPEQLIEPGTYNAEITGNFGSGGTSVGLLASLSPGPTVPLKDQNGTSAWTAASGILFIGPVGEFYAKPKITSGTGYNLPFTLTRVLNGN